MPGILRCGAQTHTHSTIEQDMRNGNFGVFILNEFQWDWFILPLYFQSMTILYMPDIQAEDYTHGYSLRYIMN